MAYYYVNNKSQANGDHEVHLHNCRYLPLDKLLLGDHASCTSAVTEAKKTYRTANGCATCSPACHTG